MDRKKFYAYLTKKARGVAENWPDCQKVVLGAPDAKFKAFLTLSEAEKWLAAGADYNIKHIAAKKGIYFDAGTGGGRGVEISVTDEKGSSLLDKILPRTHINSRGHYWVCDEGRTLHLTPRSALPRSVFQDVTNNFGELLACKYALRIAGKEGIKKIFGDSKLVIGSWSKGFLNKKGLPLETIGLVKEVKKLRDEFEQAGGKIGFIPGASNPADLGFHKG